MAKILALADLHLHKSYQGEMFQKIRKIIEDEGIDIVAIAGDCFDSLKQHNPFKTLSRIGKPVVFCLGNHDFAFQSVQDTMDYYLQAREDAQDCDVHCLDLQGHYLFSGINFFGNVLWYDGSMKDSKRYGDKIIQDWLDSTIVDFDYKAENEKCVRQLNDPANHPGETVHQILLTHCVPHFGLNAFSPFQSKLNQPSEFNMYSGMRNLFPMLNFKPEYAICGHTHRKMEFDIDGVKGINVGNDYYFHTRNIVYNIIQIA